MGKKGKAMGKAETAPKKLAAMERATEVWKLRLRGKSIPDIAKQLGCALSTVHSDLMKQADEHVRLQKLSKAQMREQIAGRLDVMISALWDKAERGDEKAIGRLRELEADRARLFGLHEQEDEIIVPVAPAESTTSTTLLFRSMTPDEVAEQRAKQTAKSAGSLPAE